MTPPTMWRIQIDFVQWYSDNETKIFLDWAGNKRYRVGGVITPPYEGYEKCHWEPVCTGSQ